MTGLMMMCGSNNDDYVAVFNYDGVDDDDNIVQYQHFVDLF